MARRCITCTYTRSFKAVHFIHFQIHCSSCVCFSCIQRKGSYCSIKWAFRRIVLMSWPFTIFHGLEKHMSPSIHDIRHNYMRSLLHTSPLHWHCMFRGILMTQTVSLGCNSIEGSAGTGTGTGTGTATSLAQLLILQLDASSPNIREHCNKVLLSSSLIDCRSLPCCIF